MTTSRQIIYLKGGLGMVALAALLTTTGCSSEEAQALEPDAPETRSLLFNIPLASNAGDACHDLQIFLYDTAGNELLGQMEVTGTEPMDDGSQLVHGLLPLTCPAISNDSLCCHMVVLGDCPETDGAPQSVKALTFGANSQKMPLYGAHDVRTRLDRRIEVLAPTMQLLRAGAQITVNLAQELTDAGISLKSATLKEANQKGYCTPDHPTKLITSEGMATGMVFRPNTDAKGDVMLHAKGASAMEALVPECATPEGEVLELALEFERNGEAYTGIFGQTLYCKNYVDNVPFDIVRGHHYIFNIRSLQTEGAVEVVVEDWTETTAEDITFN